MTSPARMRGVVRHLMDACRDRRVSRDVRAALGTRLVLEASRNDYYWLPAVDAVFHRRTIVRNGMEKNRK